MNQPQIRRYSEIDYLKGFAILLMILSHCIASDDMVKVWISSFNMPVFFVICGYLRARNNTKEIRKLSQLKLYLSKRFRQILIPYFVFGIGLTAFYQILSRLGDGEFSIKEALFKLFTLQGIESMWFLSCYFIVELFFLVIFLRLPQVFQHILGVAGILVLGYCNMTGMPDIWILRLLLKCLIGLIFVWLGYYIAKVKAVEKCPVLMVCLLLLICFVGSQINGFCGIGALQFKSVVLFILVGIVESAAFLVLFHAISSKKKTIVLSILEKFGKYSIVVVCTNNFFIEIIRLLDYKLFGNILLESKWIGNGVFFLFMSVLELLTISFFFQKCPWLFGIKDKR